MLLALRSMGRVTAAQLLALHPRERQLLELCGEHYERHTDHDDHVQLRRPNIGHKITVAHSGEGDHHVVGALE